jgi:O-antigen ligase
VYAATYTFEVITIFKTILMVLLTLYPFYFLAKKGVLRDDNMVLLFFILFPVFMVRYIYEAQSVRLGEGDGHQVNEIYGMVYLLPFLFLVKRKLIVYAVLVIMFLFVASSFKRGAFVTFSAGSVVLLYSLWKNSVGASSVNRVTTLFAALALIVVGALVAIGNEDLVERFLSVTRDGASNRDLIVETLVLALMTDTSSFQLFFGHGFAGTVPYIYTFAHNDVLEVLFNYGLVGLSVYLALWWTLWRTARSDDAVPRYKMALTAILFMWFIDSLYHRFFSGAYSVPAVMVLGYILGALEHQRARVASAFSRARDVRIVAPKLPIHVGTDGSMTASELSRFSSALKVGGQPPSC